MKNKASNTYPREFCEGNATVTVYRRRRANGTYGFEVADFSTGKRRLRSFPSAETAQAEAERIVGLLAKGDTHAASASGKDVASFGRAKELLAPTGDSLELAASRYAECVNLLGGDGNRLIEAVRFYLERHPSNFPSKTVPEVVIEFMTHRESRGASDRYLSDLRARLARFEKAFNLQISNVRGKDVQTWLDSLTTSQQTVKNFRTVLGTLFGFAERRGYFPKGTNPILETEKLKVNGGDIEIYTPVEMSKLLQSAHKDFLPALAIGAFAGLRTAELQRLAWTDIDLAGGFITISADNAKTRTRRIVPIQPNLSKWLASYSKKTGLLWRGTAETFNDAQQATAAASGVKWKPNALRHSFGSYRLANTQSAAQVSLEMGNSPQVIFRHYRELVKPAAATSWFAIAPQKPANVLSLPTASSARA